MHKAISDLSRFAVHLVAGFSLLCVRFDPPPLCNAKPTVVSWSTVIALTWLCQLVCQGVDPQGPTKMERQNPASFAAVRQRRVPSVSPHSYGLYPHAFYQPSVYFAAFYTASPPWPPLYPMTGPIRSKGERVQPPRPPNAWILYRSHKLRELPPVQGRAQAVVSKLVSDMWKNESESVRLEYERMADQRKAEHQQMYPDYRFQPLKKGEKLKQREKLKQEKQQARSEKKTRRGATSTASTSTTSAPPPPPSTEPVMPPVVYATPYGMPPGYTMMQMPYYMSYTNSEARFGPAGPSPPLSAAPSPSETVNSPSPLSKSAELPQPSTSNSVRTSPIPESQVSSASQPLPANMLCVPQSLLPGTQIPPPNPEITHLFPDMQPQAIEQIRWPQLPHQQQQSELASSDGMLPQFPQDWNHTTSAQLPLVEAPNPEVS